MSSEDDRWLENCARETGELLLANAFRKHTFVYGTMGKGSAVVKAAKMLFSRTSRFKPEQQIVARELNLFDPGVRATTLLKGSNTQMMDMYYGQAGNMLYLQRDPHIGTFVHKALRFTGPYAHEISGRDAYMNTYNTTIEAWNGRDAGVPRIGKNTITVEMSRVIRWGIARYMGTLTFEGKEVYYSQVFDRNAFHGDTDYEAMSLFEYFGKVKAPTVPFGTGKLTFMWNGVPTTPTHCHFLSNWGFDASAQALIHQAQAIEARRTDPRFAGFHAYSAKQASWAGASHFNALNTGNIEEYLKRANVSLNLELWNKFDEKPVGALQSISTDTIIRLIQSG
jgi:hypothetical protein